MPVWLKHHALVRAVSTRCLEWFNTICPTDANLVPDNPAVNQARAGQYLMAQAQFGVTDVPLGGLPGAARGS
eukprot:6633345-Heterocapsa_arctica.AAC.1